MLSWWKVFIGWSCICGPVSHDSFPPSALHWLPLLTQPTRTLLTLTVTTREFMLFPTKLQVRRERPAPCSQNTRSDRPGPAARLVCVLVHLVKIGARMRPVLVLLRLQSYRLEHIYPPRLSPDKLPNRESASNELVRFLQESEEMTEATRLRSFKLPGRE